MPHLASSAKISFALLASGRPHGRSLRFL